MNDGRMGKKINKNLRNIDLDIATILIKSTWDSSARPFREILNFWLLIKFCKIFLSWYKKNKWKRVEGSGQ